MTGRKNILECLHVRKGDITLEDTDAIVNAANPSLLGGGGVDGAIHRAAGPGLLEECRSLGPCPHGEARITGGHRLKATYVVHTPGPLYRGGRSGEREVLASSYRNSMTLAREKNLRSIAFPAISTGVYGYPKEEACRVAVNTVMEFMEMTDFILDVYFVLYDDDNFRCYANYIRGLIEQ